MALETTAGFVREVSRDPLVVFHARVGITLRKSKCRELYGQSVEQGAISGRPTLEDWLVPVSDLLETKVCIKCQIGRSVGSQSCDHQGRGVAAAEGQQG